MRWCVTNNRLVVAGTITGEDLVIDLNFSFELDKNNFFAALAELKAENDDADDENDEEFEDIITVDK